MPEDDIVPVCNPRQPGEILRPGCGIDDKPVAIIPGPVGDEIIDHTASIIEHAAVEPLAGLPQFRNVVGQQAPEKCCGIRAHDVDDRHVRDVKVAAGLADSMMFCQR